MWLAAVAQAFTSGALALTSRAPQKDLIDIGSGAGYFTGSMETYDMSNEADAEQEEEEDFFHLPRDPWAGRARNATPAAAGRTAPRTSPLPEARERNPSPFP